MKKIILLIFLVMIFLNVKGQDYVSFPTSNASWNVLLIYGLQGYPTDTSLLRYSIGGNIEINDLAYSIIYLETGDTNSPIRDTVGFLRENNKIVYYAGKDFLGHYIPYEFILYDFTKNIGDTITHDTPSFAFNSIIVDVDSVIIGESYRKRYKVCRPFNSFCDYWVEGIGSINNGLLSHITDWPTCCTHYWEHICFKENNDLVYKNPTYETCYPYNLLSTIKLQENKETIIQIFPNPIKNELNIRGIRNREEIVIEIINFLGKKIYSKKSTNNDLIKMNFNYPSGLYIIRLIDGDNKTITSTKIIK